MAKVRQFGIEAIQEINALNLTAKVDIVAGKLAGMDANAQLILATNVNTAPVRAVTVIIEGSEQKFGEAFDLEPNRALRAGRAQDLHKFFLLEGDATDLTHAKAMVGAPVYLGVDGEITTTIPVGAGKLVQKVGFVHSKGLAFIDLTQNPAGTIL